MEDNLKYEEAVEKLEIIVKDLEKGELPLDKSIELFSQGINYVKICKRHLDFAEDKIKILIDEKEVDFSQWSKED